MVASLHLKRVESKRCLLARTFPGITLCSILTGASRKGTVYVSVVTCAS